MKLVRKAAAPKTLAARRNSVCSTIVASRLQEMRSSPMFRSCLVAIAILISGPAVAQEMTAEQRTACMGDYQKFCSGTMPGDGRIIACLVKQSEKLTEACKKVVADAQKK
jgi:hypothetical protein